MDNKGRIENREKVVREFAEVINKNSLENDSNTPDFILAEYLVHQLEVFNNLTVVRNRWYDKNTHDSSAS